MYNGRSHSFVDAATGSAWAAVTAAANGIITRGVLLDIARVRDVPWLEPGLDNCDLEVCVTAAAELAVAPVRFAGTSASPIATF